MNLNHSHLNDVIRDISTFNSPHPEHTRYQKHIHSTLPSLLSATSILIGDTKDLLCKFKINYPTRIFLGDLGLDIKLPFSTCWFEYRVTNDIITENQEPIINRGVLAIDHIEALQFHPVCFYPNLKRWVMSPITYIATPSKLIKNTNIGRELLKTLNLTKIFEDRDDCIISIPIFEMYNSKENINIAIKEEVEDIGIINLALMLINSQNTILVKKTAPIVFSETKIKKGKIKGKKVDIPDHYVLKVKLPKSKGKESILEEYSLEDINLNQGYFRTYTEEKPLFGKYVGRWWWNKKE